MIRLDKFLSEMGLGTRSEVKKLIKTGQIAINGAVTAKPETKVDTDADEVSVNGRIVKYQRYEYYLFNKPSGCVSATCDNVSGFRLHLYRCNRSGNLLYERQAVLPVFFICLVYHVL